jgi:hypothetical protein
MKYKEFLLWIIIPLCMGFNSYGQKKEIEKLSTFSVHANLGEYDELIISDSAKAYGKIYNRKTLGFKKQVGTYISNIKFEDESISNLVKTKFYYSGPRKVIESFQIRKNKIIHYTKTEINGSDTIELAQINTLNLDDKLIIKGFSIVDGTLRHDEALSADIEILSQKLIPELKLYLEQIRITIKDIR